MTKRRRNNDNELQPTKHGKYTISSDTSSNERQTDTIPNAIANLGKKYNEYLTDYMYKCGKDKISMVDQATLERFINIAAGNVKNGIQFHADIGGSYGRHLRYIINSLLPMWLECNLNPHIHQFNYIHTDLSSDALILCRDTLMSPEYNFTLTNDNPIEEDCIGPSLTKEITLNNRTITMNVHIMQNSIPSLEEENYVKEEINLKNITNHLTKLLNDLKPLEDIATISKLYEQYQQAIKKRDATYETYFNALKETLNNQTKNIYEITNGAKTNSTTALYGVIAYNMTPDAKVTTIKKYYEFTEILFATMPSIERFPEEQKKYNELRKKDILSYEELGVAFVDNSFRYRNDTIPYSVNSEEGYNQIFLTALHNTQRENFYLFSSEHYLPTFVQSNTEEENTKEAIDIVIKWLSQQYIHSPHFQYQHLLQHNVITYSHNIYDDGETVNPYIDALNSTKVNAKPKTPNFNNTIAYRQGYNRSLLGNSVETVQFSMEKNLSFTNQERETAYHGILVAPTEDIKSFFDHVKPSNGYAFNFNEMPLKTKKSHTDKILNQKELKKQTLQI